MTDDLDAAIAQAVSGGLIEIDVMRRVRALIEKREREMYMHPAFTVGGIAKEAEARGAQAALEGLAAYADAYVPTNTTPSIDYATGWTEGVELIRDEALRRAREGK